MTPTILFSTTRMWNSGDDFILYGVRNLIRDVLPRHNALIWNRHPDLHPEALYRKREIVIDRHDDGAPLRVFAPEVLTPFAHRFDNSWRPGDGLDHVDFCIFAGTPEWGGVMVAPLTRALADSDVPVAYLGIGAFEGIWNSKLERLGPDDRKTIERAEIVTARDSRVASILAPIEVRELPCPALFAAPSERLRKDKRIALCVSSARKGARQPIPQKTFDFAIALFRRLAEDHDCSLVCHYSEELAHLRGLLPETVDLRYSYDAGDYAAIYDEFDLTVTTRVHGAGMCASLGIPGFVIAHSARTDTVRGFLSQLIDPGQHSIESTLSRIDVFDVRKASTVLLAHKNSSRAAYLDVLKPFLLKSARH